MRVWPSKRWIVIDGETVSYEVIGRGEPLVLVHGLSGSSLWWSRNVGQLAEHYQVYLVDLPGFGSMRHLHARFAVAHAATWLAHWMDAVHLPQAHFVGYSMGGYMCMRLAVSRPDLVRSLTLAAASGVPAYPSAYHEILPLIVSVTSTTPSFLPLLAFDALRMGPGMLVRAAKELVREDIRSLMGAITAPTLLIWGEDDILVPPWCAEVLRKGIPDARLVIVPRAGHVLMYDRPAEFNAALLTFLAGEPASRDTRNDNGNRNDILAAPPLQMAEAD
jgi:pimeloyl-ACP methyl ester carboxylesterase